MSQLGFLPPEWESAQKFVPIIGQHGQGALPVQAPVFGDDAQLSVRFFMYPEVHHLKSIEAGYEVLEYFEYVRIQRPGDKSAVLIRRVKDSDKLRFPYQYRAFKEGTAEEDLGTPIASWDYRLSESQIYAFKVLGVETVQQIAAMSDIQAQSLGIEGHEIVSRAKITVQKKTTLEANAALQKELDELKREFAKFKAQERDEESQVERLLEARRYEKEREEERREEMLARMVAGGEEAAKAVHEVVKRRGRPKKNA